MTESPSADSGTFEKILRDWQVVDETQLASATAEASRDGVRLEDVLARHRLVDPDLMAQLRTEVAWRDSACGLLQRYSLGRTLGAGAMATVYRAMDTQLRRPVALKIIRAGPGGRSLVGRFVREAEAVGRLDHPNLIRVHEAGIDGGCLYLVMELLEGGTLRERLRDRPSDRRQLLEPLAVIARAVDHVHRQGILHRDLKPANILFAADGRPVVTDFGLARFDDDQRTNLTATGAVIGTPAYMAPEQILGELARMGPPTDVYALGAILYEILTGRRPHEGPTQMAIYQSVLNRRPAVPSSIDPSVPRALDALAMAALALDPGDRPPSAAAFAERLENRRPAPAANRSGRTGQRGGRGARRRSSASVRRRSPATRSWRVPAAIAVVLLVVASAVGALAASWGRDPEPIAARPAAGPRLDGTDGPRERAPDDPSAWQERIDRLRRRVDDRIERLEMAEALAAVDASRDEIDAAAWRAMVDEERTRTAARIVDRLLRELEDLDTRDRGAVEEALRRVDAALPEELADPADRLGRRVAGLRAVLGSPRNRALDELEEGLRVAGVAEVGESLKSIDASILRGDGDLEFLRRARERVRRRAVFLSWTILRAGDEVGSFLALALAADPIGDQLLGSGLEDLTARHARLARAVRKTRIESWQALRRGDPTEAGRLWRDLESRRLDRPVLEAIEGIDEPRYPFAEERSAADRLEELERTVNEVLERATRDGEGRLHFAQVGETGRRERLVSPAGGRWSIREGDGVGTLRPLVPLVDLAIDDLVAVSEGDDLTLAEAPARPADPGLEMLLWLVRGDIERAQSAGAGIDDIERLARARLWFDSALAAGEGGPLEPGPVADDEIPLLLGPTARRIEGLRVEVVYEFESLEDTRWFGIASEGRVDFAIVDGVLAIDSARSPGPSIVLAPGLWGGEVDVEIVARIDRPETAGTIGILVGGGEFLEGVLAAHAMGPPPPVMVGLVGGHWFLRRAVQHRSLPVSGEGLVGRTIVYRFRVRGDERRLAVDLGDGRIQTIEAAIPGSDAGRIGFLHDGDQVQLERWTIVGDLVGPGRQPR